MWRVRAQMRADFPAVPYRQRALVESFFSAVKRKLSARAAVRSPATQQANYALLNPHHDSWNRWTVSLHVPINAPILDRQHIGELAQLTALHGGSCRYRRPMSCSEK
jgi:hypothetical protein